jgi:TonB family protein
MTRLLILAGAVAALAASASAQTGGPAEAPYSGPVTNPAWITVHQPAYPELARTHYVPNGFVRLRCTARASGAVDACEILEETPAGQGFGEAALNVMPRARIRPRTENGRPVDSRVVQSFRFALTNAAPVSTQAALSAAEAADRPASPPTE